jgi:hypothetical protein
MIDSEVKLCQGSIQQIINSKGRMNRLNLFFQRRDHMLADYSGGYDDSLVFLPCFRESGTFQFCLRGKKFDGFV